MLVLNSIARMAAKPMSGLLTPRHHASLDYLNVASFLIGGAVFWKTNRKAAIGAWICGGAQLAVSLLTDYSGSTGKMIGFRQHGEIDLGLAAMSATMPEFMGLKGSTETKFFLTEGVLITLAHGLTPSSDRGKREPTSRKAA